MNWPVITNNIYSLFEEAINRYNLIEDTDKLGICISGGKDSMLMALLFMEYQKQHSIELEYLIMDPGYDKANREKIESNIEALNIPAKIFDTKILESANADRVPCYRCAQLRRKYLYQFAKEKGCNKIALGHHYNDVIETVLMGMLYGGQVQSMMPKVRSTIIDNMELIRPLYLIKEEEIINWRDTNNLEFIECACKFTRLNKEVREDGSSDSKRREIKELIKNLKERYPEIEENIFKSVENIELKNIIGWKDKGFKKRYIDDL